MRPNVLVAGVFVAVSALGALGALSDRVLADTIEKSGTFGGMTVHYKVVVPPGYDPARCGEHIASLQ